jgi:hypothetical protein
LSNQTIRILRFFLIAIAVGMGTPVALAALGPCCKIIYDGLVAVGTPPPTKPCFPNGSGCTRRCEVSISLVSTSESTKKVNGERYSLCEEFCSNSPDAWFRGPCEGSSPPVNFVPLLPPVTIGAETYCCWYNPNMVAISSERTGRIGDCNFKCQDP